MYLVKNMKDVVNYEVSKELMLPSNMDNHDGLLTFMEESPIDFVSVSFLGSTYTVYQKRQHSTRVGVPQLVNIEGHHFKNQIAKRFWAFAEEYFWDKYAWSVAEMDGE